jgi:hypothetical protein
MATCEKVILRKKLINIFELIITDKDVYICQNMSIKRRINKFIEDKLTPIQEIKDITLIDEGIKILKLHLLALMAKEGCYLP